MIWLDWIIVAIVGYNVVTGLFSGFLRSLINLVALVVAYLLTPVVKGPLAAIVQATFGLQDYLAVPLGAFLAWTLVYVAISAAGMILSKIVNMTPLMIVDRLGGAAFGLFISALLILLPLAAVQSLPFIKSIPALQQTLKTSKVVTALQPAIGFVETTAGPMILNYWLKPGDQKDMKQSLPGAKPSTTPGTKPSVKPGPGQPSVKPTPGKK
ncbi:MAG TPA: CvpA family protein [Candidatus Obscuribacterales bacterium]